MIRLEVDEFCQCDCLDFEPDVIGPTKLFRDGFFGDEVTFTDTIVSCAHKNRCRGIKRYLERSIKDSENS